MTPVKEVEMNVCDLCRRPLYGSGHYCEDCKADSVIDPEDFGETDYYDKFEDERDE